MKSVYEKDISKLWFVLIMTFFCSITLVGYSYSYNVDNINKNDFSLTTVYNTGRNTCMLTGSDIYSDKDGLYKGIECKFTVMGYNDSNNDLSYKIIIKNNQQSSINNNLIKMYLVNNRNNFKIGPLSGDNLFNGSLQEEIKVLKNSSIFDEYSLKMWISEEELINNNWYNLENNKFIVNIDVIY